jgi:hypothetical protein
MARWLALLLVLTAAPGCGHFEDMMFGPETCAQAQPSSGCSQAAARPNIAETQEPPR